jgi:hypothetical protein
MLRGIMLTVLLALSSLVPRAAFAVAPVVPVAHAGHHAPASGHHDDADCAAACVGCSVSARLPMMPPRVVVSPEPVTLPSTAAMPPAIIAALDPPPPRKSV